MEMGWRFLKDFGLGELDGLDELGESNGLGELGELGELRQPNPLSPSVYASSPSVYARPPVSARKCICS